MSSNQSSQNSELPQDIVKKISEYLRDQPEKLVTLMCFFSDHDNQSTQKYIQTLRAVFNNEKAFQGIVDKLVEDTTKLRDDPNYLLVMADIWNNYLEPNEKKNVGDGQRFDFQSILSTRELMGATASASYNFIATLSKLDSSAQGRVITLIINVAENTVGTDLALTLSQRFNNLLQVSRSPAGKMVSVGLLAVYLTIEAWNNLKLWYNGEISGKRCAKSIIDSLAGAVGGYGGGMAGAAMGTYIFPGVGTVIGAVVGSVAGTTVTSSLSDWATLMMFDLPKSVALENAYIFLGLQNGASNDEINSSFRRLALRYHPDKGGNYDDWHKLQLSMGIVKLSKGEI
jgi:hypothetical protein